MLKSSCSAAFSTSRHISSPTASARRCRGFATSGKRNKRFREMKKILALAAAAAISMSLSVAAQNAGWDAKFRAIPNAKNIGDYIKRMSARPHHLGSPYDKDNAEWIQSKFKEWGWDARIETYEVLFPTPKERLVEMVGPSSFKLKLEEPAVADDPTSGQ